jgi:hypothetical protein
MRSGLVSVGGPRWSSASITETNMARKSTKQPAPKSSKHNALLKLLHSNKGATLPQMQRETGWQPHSVRGFLSGTVKKRLGLTLKSEQGKDGERRYQIIAG